MPEETRRRGEVAGGFWIRRVASPAWAVTRPRRLVRAAGRDKENTSPAGSAAGPTWRRRRTRKSPLPEWYPRTPLRDITAIVNAYERRRLQVQAARAAQAANRDNEASPAPQNALPTSPSAQEQTAPNQTLPTGSTPDPAPRCTAPSLSPTEHPLQMSSASSSFSPTVDCSHHIPSVTDDVTPRNIQPTVNEEKLCDSIDQIGKIVMKNLKKEEPATKRGAQRKTLMSMR